MDAPPWLPLVHLQQKWETKKGLSTLPSLHFWRYRYLPQATFQYLYKLPTTTCAAGLCSSFHSARHDSESWTTPRYSHCQGVKGSHWSQSPSILVAFSTSNQRRVSLILHAWGPRGNQWWPRLLWVTRNLWKYQENLFLSKREHEVPYSGLQVDTDKCWQVSAGLSVMQYLKSGCGEEKVYSVSSHIVHTSFVGITSL